MIRTTLGAVGLVGLVEGGSTENVQLRQWGRVRKYDLTRLTGSACATERYSCRRMISGALMFPVRQSVRFGCSLLVKSLAAILRSVFVRPKK